MHLTCLDQPEINAIHQATLDVLSEVGILIDDEEARKLLIENGARQQGNRICLPASLVEIQLGKCPQQVVLSGREKRAVLGSGELHVHNLGGARDVLDAPDGELRPALADDVASSARLLDALENVTTITPLYTPRDVPTASIPLVMFDRTVRNTLKPINGPGVSAPSEVQFLAEMARVVFGDQPAFSLGVSPVSPLNFKGHIAPAILEVARQRLVFGPLPCPNVGATSPMSLAGSLVQQNAEVLASIVLAQLVRPGLPVIYCGRLSVLNMRSGTPMWGNPEVGIMAAATVQIGHFYHLPVNVYGLAGSGCAADMLNGYERITNALLPALAGADELSGVGEMAGGVFSANFQMVIDNDIVGRVRRIRSGFRVDDDSLAVEVIAHAMDTTRNFLREPHTRKYLRAGEVWHGALSGEDLGWQGWNAVGRPAITAKAHQQAGAILAAHEVPPLPEEQSRELDKILAHAL